MAKGYMRPLTPEREEHLMGSKLRSLVLLLEFVSFGLSICTDLFIFVRERFLNDGEKFITN